MTEQSSRIFIKIQNYQVSNKVKFTIPVMQSKIRDLKSQENMTHNEDKNKSKQTQKWHK